MNKIQALQVAVSAALAVMGKATQAGKSAKGEAVAAVRAVAKEAAESGIPHDVAGKVWQAVAKVERRPSGTWKPYTKHVQGFTILAASGKNLDTGKDGKAFTQADAVEAFKVATTPQAVLDELQRITDAVALFRKRIGGDAVEGFDWSRPSADDVAEVLAMLPAHPSEAADVTETTVPKSVTEGQTELAELYQLKLEGDASADDSEDSEADESGEAEAATPVAQAA